MVGDDCRSKLIHDIALTRPLAGQRGDHPLVYRPLGNEMEHAHRVFLTLTVKPGVRLLVQLKFPPGGEPDDATAAELHVQTECSRRGMQQEHPDITFVPSRKLRRSAVDLYRPPVSVGSVKCVVV